MDQETVVSVRGQVFAVLVAAAEYSGGFRSTLSDHELRACARRANHVAAVAVEQWAVDQHENETTASHV